MAGVWQRAFPSFPRCLPEKAAVAWGTPPQALPAA